VTRNTPTVIGLTLSSTQDGRAHIDGAACGIRGPEVVAVPEERLSRRKHDGGAELALRAILDGLEVAVDDVDAFFVSTCGEVAPPTPPYHLRLSERSGLDLRDLGIPDSRVRWVPSHHLSHAMTACLPRAARPTLVLVADDAGTGLPGEPSVERATSFALEGNRLRQLSVARAQSPEAGGCGAMYRYITDFLGMDGYRECGKTMALAAYGGSSLSDLDLMCRDRPAITRLRVHPKGTVAAVRILLEGSRVHIPTRRPDTPIAEGHMDLARRAQDELEASLLDLLKAGMAAMDAVDPIDVRLSGGVASNCVMAGRLSREPGVGSIAVATAPGDTGQALGNALFGCEVLGLELPSLASSPFLGPRYTQNRIERAISHWSASFKLSRGSTVDRAAKLLEGGSIVAIWRGRSEYGPRALGHRSILADPRTASMKDRLNRHVKKREEFRPYGLALLGECAPVLFGMEVESPAMMMAFPVPTRWRSRIPAVCHVDGTCRVQTVTRDSDSYFHSIIDAFYQATGVPGILNTSFNDAGRPIVETPEDALFAFHSMQLDALVMEDWLVEK
jgi:carbamoyltransferase